MSLEDKQDNKLVLACVEDHPKAILLLRAARYRAQENNLQWGALFTEKSNENKAVDESVDRLERLQALTRQMGGQVMMSNADSNEKGLLNYLEKEHARCSLVIIGDTETDKRTFYLKRSTSTKMARTASRYTKVETLLLNNVYDRPSIGKILYGYPMHLWGFTYALCITAVACLAALVMKHLFHAIVFPGHIQIYTLPFLVACVFSAGAYGLLAGLFSALMSIVILNYYFAVPYHVFKFSQADLLGAGCFLVCALIISFFISQIYLQKEYLVKKEFRSQLLFTLYRAASGSFSRQQSLEKLQHKLSKLLELEVAFFLPPVGEPEHIELNYPMDIMLDEKSQVALEACWKETRSFNIAHAGEPACEWYFEPMISPSGEIGILGIRPQAKVKIDSWSKQLFGAIADQTASILEHIQQERSMEAVRISDEKEKLRSMLLSSVSHDFKTPLAGIIGALSVHRSLGERLSPQKRDELLEAAMEEAQRLDSFITNILDMTRLESGNIRFNFEWHSIHTTIRNVQKRLQQRLRQHELVVLPSEDADVYLDSIMTEQVLQNVLDNACKYTPAHTKIELHCRPEGESFICTIRDYGGGVPPGSIDLVFDKYTRLHKKDSQVAGTGLGLAISRAVMEAQGGSITVVNHPDGGAVFTLRFPKWRNAEILKKNGTSV